MASRRALHFVFKVSDRRKTIDFYKRILGMKILRHEEFMEGCKASCNGPYNGKWSKTMVGYGPEDSFFAIELTYNYGVGSYKRGNDFQYIRIDNDEAFKRICSGDWPIESKSKTSVKVLSPDGYAFVVHDAKPDGDPIKHVCLSCSNPERSKMYWAEKCGILLSSSNLEEALFCFSPDQCHLKLLFVTEPINHASAFGRIAFSCPSDQLPELQALMDKENETILTRLTTLDTPGKASVQVIILADPDGHEICFVGDEGFRELSRIDPEADALLEKAMSEDKSDEWFQKHGGKSAE